MSSKQSICFSVVDRIPMGCKFTDNIRASWVEGGILILGWGCGTIHFRGSCLVILDLPSYILYVYSHSFKEAQFPLGYNINSLIWVLK